MRLVDQAAQVIAASRGLALGLNGRTAGWTEWGKQEGRVGRLGGGSAEGSGGCAWAAAAQGRPRTTLQNCRRRPVVERNRPSGIRSLQTKRV